MTVRGIRGAITVNTNSAEEIVSAAQILLGEIAERNEVAPDDIASVLLTTTEDLDAAFPARATRNLTGWEYVPVTCAREIPVPGSLPRCIRVLMNVNTSKGQREIKHVYLRDAVRLRPDLANK